MSLSYKKLLEKGVLNVSLYYQIERLKKINFKEYLELGFEFNWFKDEIIRCENLDELGKVLFDKKSVDIILLGEDIERFDEDGIELFNNWFEYIIDSKKVDEEGFVMGMLFDELFELNEFKIEELENEFVDLGYDKVSIMIEELKVMNYE